MKSAKIFPVIVGVLFSSASALVHAQAGPSDAVPLTRQQVIQERDQYLKTHVYDTMNEVWVSTDAIAKTYGRKFRKVAQSEEPDSAIAKK